MSKKNIHGGDLDGVSTKYNVKKEDIIDFSGNINPLGFPQNVTQKIQNNLNVITTYPDKNYTNLKKSISNYVGVDSSYIVVGNGSTELISNFIKSSKNKNALIVSPAYSEYERDVNIHNGVVNYFFLKEEDNFKLNIDNILGELNKNIGMLILCNPNNPTGTGVTISEIEIIAKHCIKNDIQIMIDETYIEFCYDISIYSAVSLVEKFDNIFVIRGTSKIFAAPGLRLGYGISSNKNYIELLTKTQDPWSVNSIASYAGELLFLEKEFIADTKFLIDTERKKALELFSNNEKIKCYPTLCNFLLLKILDKNVSSSEIFEKLISKNILLRNAKTFVGLDETFIRFCFLSKENNELLYKSLFDILND